MPPRTRGRPQAPLRWQWPIAVRATPQAPRTVPGFTASLVAIQQGGIVNLTFGHFVFLSNSLCSFHTCARPFGLDSCRWCSLDETDPSAWRRRMRKFANHICVYTRFLYVYVKVEKNRAHNLILPYIRGVFFYVVYPFWTDLVYWVGFGAAMAFTTHLFLLRFCRFSTFLVFLSEVAIFWKSCFFANFAFSIDFGDTLLPKCSYWPCRGIILGLSRNLSIDYKLPVRSGFLGGFPHFCFRFIFY